MIPLPALPWLVAFLSFFRLARKHPNLEQTPPLRRGPKISVIVPARNEADSIRTVVTSVLGSSYPDFELLVVDDRSTDATAAIVAEIAAGDARCRLIAGAELPDGWYGKPWACAQGARAATGTLLCFTDADTRHGPELLGRAAAALEREAADLVTIAPRQRCITFWERLVMPQVWVLLGLRYHPATVNAARRARDVIANGQFILVRRDGYNEIGTHEAVRHEVAEDLALAQAFWRGGKKLHFAFAESQMETRMYTDLGHLIEGWSKNIYLGGRRSFPEEPVRRALVPVILGGAMLYWLLPPLLLGAVALGLLPAGWEEWTATATAACFGYWILVSLGMGIPAWYGLGYPLGAVMTLYIIGRSTARGGGRVEWKGRTYGAGVNG